jgi:hypothetical protein
MEMITRLLMIASCLLVVLPLSACDVPPPATPGGGPVAELPGAAPVCAALKSDKFDLVLRSYGAVADAINLLIDTKVVVPGSARALAIANANDKALTALSTAEHARAACNAASYTAALAELSAALTEVRAALRQ